MTTTQKFLIDPESLARVRDEALAAAKKTERGDFIALAALADEILRSYGNKPELREFQGKKVKLG